MAVTSTSEAHSLINYAGCAKTGARTGEPPRHLRRPGCPLGREAQRQMEETIGAGEGNRTLVISLEGCCSTIELHPHRGRERPARHPASVIRPALVMVGEVGL